MADNHRRIRHCRWRRAWRCHGRKNLEHCAYLDYVVLSRPHISVDFIEPVRAHTDAKVIYYGHDIHHLRLGEQFKVTGDAEVAREQARFQALEERMWGRSDLILYPADGETRHVCEWLSNHHVDARAATVPLYAYDTVADNPAGNLDQRRDLLFVAGFGHPPNADGAAWFISEVMPLLRERHPDIHLYLVGSNPTEAVRALASDAVTVTGYVSDDELAMYYARARVAVAPLRYGGGMKGKVLESMRFGLPCVTTSTGAQGLADAAGFLGAADDPVLAAEAVSRLLRDDDAWRTQSTQAQAFIRERFSAEAVWAVLAESIDATPYIDVGARRRVLQSRLDS